MAIQILISVLLWGTVTSQSSGPLYPISGTTNPPSDDGSSPLITLQQTFFYFGKAYNRICVNQNGHLTFDGPWGSYVPQRIPIYGSRDIIAPFWTDLDNRENGQVFYNQYTNGSVLKQATQDINAYFPRLNFNCTWVFVATWYEVAYYPTTGTRTTVQAVLISGSQYSFVLMNYGIIAATVHSVQAGYDTINSTHYFSIPGSFSNNASGSNSNFRLSSNINVPGRWAFQVDRALRGCTFKGASVQQGDSFWSDSTCVQKCTCTSTGLQCVSQPCSFSQVCQPSAFQFSCQSVQRRSCTISGDPHYCSFDGTWFDFQGSCTYVLSEQCRRGLPYYRVEGSNEHRGSTYVSWIRLIKVYVYNETIELVKGHGGEAKVNGIFATTPFYLRNGSVQVYGSVTVSTDFGLEVSYDADHYVTISLPYTYQNATCGLCGNFNNDPRDDFQTRQGQVVSSAVIFANSWQTSGSNETGCEPQCAGLDCAPCSEAKKTLYITADQCGILLNSSGPFASCHQRLPPQTFAENCVYDLCVGGGYQPILCQALNVYASQCQQNGIQLSSWRRPGFCEIPCPSNSHFESQGTGCPATCVNPNSTVNCPLPSQESCICNSGYILSAGVCVPHAECGCSFEGRYYRSGETVILDEDCGRNCSCSYGSMTCQSHHCGQFESCSVEGGTRGCKPKNYATCWKEGPTSYHTFDGLTFDYPGACRFTLATVTDMSRHPQFVVTLEKMPTGQQGFAWVVKFESEGSQVSIEIANASKVQVDGQLIRLPFSSASSQIQIYFSNIHSVILRTAFGVTVQTVWPSFVRVTAPGVYSSSLGGICGNYNGHPSDDFQTPNGPLVNSSQVFGDSWRNGSLAPQCVESRNYNSTTNTTGYCGILELSQGPFAKCWETVDRREHVRICDNTVKSSINPAVELCDVLRDIAFMCQNKGLVLGSWRNITGCELTCPVNSHYELCGTSCPSTCPSLSFPFSCDTVCQEGCKCDEGFVLNGNQCVPPTSCGCYHQGRYHQGGEQFWDGEQCESLCTCNGITGFIHCIPSSCGPQETCRVVRGEFGCHPNPPGTCSASGDPHYLTFDHKAYDFQGSCHYVLAAVCNVTDGLPQFSVESKNEPWNGWPVSVTAEVFVNVGGNHVRLSRESHGVVQVNGVTKTLPVLLNGNSLAVFASGYLTVVNADFGLSVTYDGWSTVSISVPSNYSGKTCGLCGNFNGNPNDDFLTPSGRMVSTPDEFGTAWKVVGNSTCSDGCGSSCPQCIIDQPARAKCEVIQAADGPFSFCHEMVDPAPYFNDCVFDVCVSGNGGQDLLCRTIQAYASACQSANVPIYPWRQNTTCTLNCPVNSHYELCGADCGQTCASSINANCGKVCSEGCFCNEGFFRSGMRCVPVESCGCQYDGFYYNLGESFWTEGCSQQCKCHAPNDLRCSAASCTPAQQCTIRNGQLGCFGSMSTCTVWGDPHYITFDGAVAHFQGTCSYIITESVSHSTNDTWFQVAATNNHRGNDLVSFVSAVDIYLSNQRESEHIRIGLNKRVKVNGSEVSLPTTTGSLAKVVRNGNYIVVESSGLIVQFDGTSTLLVRVAENHQNRVTGMCGNFNGDPADDITLPNGTLAQNDNDFGNSWKAPTSQQGCASINADGVRNCTFRDKYSELCRVITNTSGPFSVCHPHSDPQPFYNACIYDLCLYAPANSILCSAVSAYEKTCSVLGLNILSWHSGLHCAERDPCEQLNCTEYEWCGEKDGVYSCFSDQQQPQIRNESYGPLYPISGIRSPQPVDRSSPGIPLEQPFLYFGRLYNKIYVNQNGHLTFDSPWESYIPQRFPIYGFRDIIAPFWTNLNNSQNGQIYYNQYTSGSVLQQATQDINKYFSILNFNANWVFVATWYEVAYYATTETRTTVQAVLISGGFYSFVLLNYGIIAPTSYNVQAGYDTINSTYYFSIPGSFSNNASGSNSNFHLSSNVNVPGRWAFQVDRVSGSCIFRGALVQRGESFWSDSTCVQKCTCTSTGLQCVSQPCSFSQVCQPSAFQFSCQSVQRRSCTISGDPHYCSFDGTRFDFQGSCTYVLSEQCHSGLPYYRVEGSNEHRGSTYVSWIRLIKVYVYNETIELVKGHGGEAKVNGIFATTPFYLRNGSVQVYGSVTVSTDFGLEVSYDADHYVTISLPYTYQNATCGLCGNFNNDPRDDFQTRQGQVVSSAVIFANSWQTSVSNETGCEPQCAGLDCAPCSEAKKTLYITADQCGILLNSSGPFASCHQRLPPQTFAENCVYDLCVGGGYQPILCQALNVYASQCQKNGIQLSSWRRPGFCEIPCPSNSHFESQGTGCPATCVNPNSTVNCPLPSQESCICNSGYILSAGVCVPHAECGCSFEGRYYRSGETVILDEDCGRNCSCSYGSMTCQSHHCGQFESCSVEGGTRGCKPKNYATCWKEGPTSYHTFDGLTFDYPGACRFTLATVTDMSRHPQFVVTLEKMPTGQQGFAWVVKFESEGSQVSIEIANASKVQVDGQLIRLPFSSASSQIQIYFSNIHSVILRTAFGVTVQTVWPSFVRVTAPGVYSSSLGGICGNYNGHPSDDFQTPNGPLVNSSQVFGDSWRNGSLAPQCVESRNYNSTTNTTGYCGILELSQGPFAKCWETVDRREHVRICDNTVKSSINPAVELCDVLRDIAFMCQNKGLVLGSWRNITGCELTCPVNSHYELCGTSCPSTCPSLSFPFSCDTVCQEGCKCDEGFVLNGNQCVPPTSCGCYHQGRYHQGGEQFWDGEQCESLCTCNGITGFIHCIPSSCGPQETCRVVRGEFGCHPNPPGTCSASGDPHYLTFDHKAYDFQGSCHYVLAAVCNVTDGLPQFSVESKNEPWNGWPVSVTAEVFVNVGGNHVRLSRESHGVVQVNGVTKTLPVLLNGNSLAVFASGYLTVVNADFGLSVTYDGWSTVSISVPSNYSGKTCGLCGNFNGNPNDDFLTPSGRMVSTPDEFGTAWKVVGNSTCSDGCGSSCPQCIIDQPARAKCEVIQAADGPFSFCHEMVDPAPYFNDCVFDVCVSGNGGQDLLCRTIQAYASACQSANVPIYPWRQNTTCTLNCPVNSHYELCGADCGQTCASSINANCGKVCSEGCFCNEGFFRSGMRCVPVESCGCQYDGFYYNLGESFWTEGCSQQCKCHAPNDLRCSAASCTPAQQCTIRNGQLGCFGSMSTCTVWGDPHYITFDGAVAHFQGTCSYIITESVSHSTNDTWFQVAATNNHRGNDLVSFVSAVDIYLSNQRESEHIRIGLNKIVKVNGSEVSLPTTTGSLAKVVRNGNYIVVESSGLIVQFDGTSTLLVRVAENHQNRVTGMCGNFNGDPADDITLPNGTLAQNDNDFGNSWKAPTSQQGCASINADGVRNCTFRDKYSELCRVITNTSGPFSVCHPHSDPQPFYNACIYDLCLYAPANSILCSAVSAYEKTCSVLGLNILSWHSGLHCAERDPCEQLNCTEYEWCGEKDGVYSCFSDQQQPQIRNESYGPLYPISGIRSPQPVDRSSPGIPLEQPFLYFGRLYNKIYVNQNGHLTFDSPWESYIPQRFPIYGFRDIIAPFWTNLNNSQNGQIYYNQYTSGSVLQQATQDINKYFSILNFNANWVFVATWYEVAYYATTETRTTVQAVLISGGFYSFVLLNYGIIAPTSYNVQAGYDTINSTYYFSIPGSFSNNASGSNSNFHLSSNVNVPGRWAFQVDRVSGSCIFRGALVQQGESFWSDSTCVQKCTCTSTGLQCVSQPCSFSQVCQPSAFQFSCQSVQRGSCTISGDPHYCSFDGTWFDFQGSCTYVLSEQCRRGLPYYRVEGSNEHRGSTYVSWIRLIKVYVYNETIELVKGHGGEAKVNGIFATTPFYLRNGSVQVYGSVTVSTDFGLEVSYDADHYVTISLPYTYQNATCGLCGNFNNDPRDDFQTRQGQVVSSAVIFANSWQTSGSNETGCEPQCAGLDCAPCSEAKKTLYITADQCGILLNSSGPFASCHQRLPPQTFAENCVYDLCVGGGYQPILCQALNVYASQCQKNGIQLSSWRRPGFCEIPCPSNSHFESQGTGCPATCVNPNSTVNCPLPSQESCICNSGYILSAGVCVPHAECGCSFEGRYYRSGETVILDEDCGRNCSCSYGSMTCQSHHCGQFESCSVEGGTRGCKPKNYATCWKEGPTSYHTFDGLTFDYPGACRFTLATVTDMSRHPQFVVTLEKMPTGQQGFAWVVKFESEGSQVSIEIANASKVQVDGQLIRLPFSSASSQIQIYFSNIHSVILRTAFGVTVQTVWPSFVRVTAPGVYSSSLGGICGNYNGHPSDDFQTPNGPLVNSSQVFGDSWRNGSLAPQCVESRNYNSTTNTTGYCGILELSQGPFAKCWETVDRREHVRICDNTVKSSINPAVELCDVLRDIAFMCQNKGLVLGSWRNITGCELTCPVNSHYELCGTSCPSTCPSLSFPFSCDTVCQEGCKCDEGFVLNGNQCVPPTSCGCYHQGRYHQGGEQFWDGEQCESLCTCNGITGFIHCIPSSCGPQETCRVVRGEFGCHPNPPGTCSASGDPHYLTFDHKAYDFQGSCHYVLAAVCNVTDGLPQFSVESKNEPWNGWPVSVTAEVFVNVGGNHVRLSRESHGVVQVNGVTKTLPVLLNGNSLAVFASGYLTVVNADFGLSVTYDGWSTVSISVPSNYSGKTCGLCGNFNGNPNDDFLTPSGRMVSTPDEFGTAWKVVGNSTCSDGCGSSCPQCIIDQPARAKCEVIQAADGPFSFCHEMVDPAPYFNDCVFDVCVSGNGGQDLLCRTIQAYASACQSANVPIYPWRQNTTCTLNCPVNSHYELCGADCGQTCASSINANCGKVCSEGCFCNEGFFRSGMRCVPVESCGCQYDGFYYNLGESFWTEGCSQQCKCHAPNDLRCSAASCTPAQQCTIRNGQLGCFGSMSTCTVWGDPHYITFDGAVAHFQGTCSYIITESVSHSTNDTWFQVAATNNHRGNDLVSFVSAVDIYLSNQRESEHIRIGLNKRVKVNGSEVSLPTTTGSLAKVVRNGNYIVVESSGLIVQFDGTSTLLVRVAENHQNRVTGMCGNFNGDPADDITLPNGTLAQNDNDFGNSWKAPTSQQGCASINADGVRNCTFRDKYSELCRVITNTSGPFSVCHPHSDPQPFYNACIYDLCLYAPANSILCSAVSAYEKTCSVLGLNILSWHSGLHCAERDPCEQLNCTEYEWCGEKDGVYSCFSDQQQPQIRNESYGPLYPISGIRSPQPVDRSSPGIPLEQPFLYFGRLYNKIYVNQNGHLTFDSPWESYIPQRFPIYGFRDIIAPFWTNLNNSQNGQIYYNQYTSGSVLQQATQDINKYFSILNFNANWVFVATWYEVAYYATTETRTTVQAVLISGGFYSFVLLNYGIIAPTSYNVQAGYDTINSTYYFSIPGSFSNNASGSNSNFHLSSNVNVPGRWAFQVDRVSGSCIFRGALVQRGESFWSDSTCVQKCTCTSTGLQCVSQPCSFSQVCQPSAFQFSCQSVQRRSCTISGDPHYCSFDGTRFDFQGSCTYVLSEQCHSGLPYYRVEGSNEHRGSTYVSWIRLIKVYVYNETIELVKGHGGEAKVNGIFATTPFYLRNGSVQVYGSVTVSTDFGLEVSYDADHYVTISLPYTYQNATCGLCGNFNNDPRDDFQTRQGQVVSSAVIFANSWQTSVSNETGCEPQCAGLDCAPCSEAKKTLYITADQCGILLNSSGPFASCHQRLPPQTFAENCVYDLCVGGGYQPILCQALNVYASQCQKNGIQLSSWRRPGFCEIPCPSNSHFESQGTGCPATCVNPNSTVNCPLPSQESCICNSGYILSAGVCVPHAECGCSFEGRYYRSGETVILDEDCGRNCSCSYGSMTCQSHHCGQFESCSVEGGTRGCKPKNYATCWKEGPTSYHTFDGLTFDYPGACRFTLATVTDMSRHPQFVVTLEKMPTGQQGFAWVVKFESEGSQVSIEIANASKVQVDGQLIRLPFSSASSQIQIYFSNIHSVILRTAFGVTVQTVWPSFVRVTAPGVYSSSLGGICGNYNGHPSDDFQTPNGPLVNSSQVFGDSWRNGSLAPQCVESRNYNSTTNTTGYCGILELSQGPFAKCWETVDRREHVRICDNTVKSSINPAVELCDVLRDIAFMCQNKGLVLGSWRNITGCELTCPVNSHYELCGTSCPSTCPSLSFPFSCDTVCQEGCKCDEGFVLNGNQCVPPTSCGCYHQGRYHQGGEQFWDGEQCESLCTCNGITGFIHCIPSSCGPQETCRVVRGEFGCHPNPPGTCSASGDPHYLTFDHKAYDFQGSCHYVLAAVCNVTDGLPQFSVESKNEPWNGWPVSVTAEVFVNVGGNHVRLSRESHGVVQVNGVTKTLPVLLNGNSLAVFASGYLTVVNADFGLSVTYDGWSTVSISVPSNYSGKTCGLCGNFNGNPNDDFLTPSGRMVSTPDEFGTAWKVVGNSTCSDGCGSSCPQCIIDQPARAKCEVIQAADGPFSFCHEMVDPAPYFNDCVFDVCVSGNGGQDLLCRTIQAYASACQSANVPIYPWRQNTTCTLNCPVNSHYELCGADCGQTCASSINANCGKVCSEGCFCNEGFFRSGMRCVPVESCGCQYDGFYYNLGESFWTEGCSQQCKCHAPNDLRCSAASCTPAQQCTIRNGQLGCFGSMSTCTVWGDPHYITFDGAVAHFQGTCSYIITESVSHSTNDTWFQVAATNNHRGNDLVSFVSAVDIYLSNQRESEHIRIGLNKRVKVNGSEVSLPTTTGSLAKVVRNGNYIVVESSGLIVQFDGTSTLLVRVAENHQNRVTGMCGNFNGDPADDITLPNGTLAQNDNDFGNSWKAPTSQQGCASINADGVRNCTFRDKYSELCRVITNTSGPFSVCHPHSDPQPFYNACIYDLCLYAPANSILCSAVSAYEKTCSVLGLNILEWRSDLQCAQTDPCEQENCTESEWCGEKGDVYGCFCDEHSSRPNSDSYDSSITCVSSSGTISLSRCQLFEAGFHPNVLHLRNNSCKGTLQEGRLVFHFNNDDQLCGTVLKSNGTHFKYENAILGDEGLNIQLVFSCEYLLTQELSMDLGINPIESSVRKELPSGQGRYHLRILPYKDPGFRLPLTSENNIEMEMNQRLYVEVRTEGVDEREIGTILDFCWATPVNNASYPVHHYLIIEKCPNPADGTVELLQSGNSTVARFSFQIFTFTNFSSIYLHCEVHLCILKYNRCTADCNSGNQRFQRDTSYYDTVMLSLGPMLPMQGRYQTKR